MDKTFLQIEPGDIIYYIIFEKSKLETKGEIKTSIVANCRNTDLAYEKEITLKNGLKFICNWNTSIHEVPIINAEQLKYRNSIAEPLFFTMYGTDKNLLKKTARKLIEDKIERLGNIQMEIQEELVRLSALRLLTNGLETKKVEELVTETVIV